MYNYAQIVFRYLNGRETENEKGFTNGASYINMKGRAFVRVQLTVRRP